MATIPEAYKDLLVKAAFAHLADAGWQSAVTPVWVDYDGTHVRVITQRTPER